MDTILNHLPANNGSQLPPMPKRIKRITSHRGLAVYLSYVETTGSEIPRFASIPSPYAYSPTHPVYRDEQGRNVIVVETAHKRYDVFEVPASIIPVPEVL